MQFAAETRRPVRNVSPAAADLLREYAFPGNIRELRNMMERAVIVCDGNLIQPQDLDFQAIGDEEGGAETLDTCVQGGGASAGMSADHHPEEGAFDLATADTLDLAGLERAAVVEALRRADGNQVQAAKLLGITRFALRRRMAQYDLGDSDSPE